MTESLFHFLLIYSLISFRSINHRKQQGQPFPWQVFALAFEIALLVIVALIWAVRLFRRGKKLKARAKFEDTCQEKWTQNTEENQPEEFPLLRKCRDLHRARLRYDEEEVREKESALKDYLSSEYERLEKNHDKDARRLMMLRIRTVLIQNPYDHIGRSMASDAKTIFLRHVLKKTNPFQKLQCLLKIPSWLKKGESAKKILMTIPVMMALWGTAQKGFFYRTTSTLMWR